MYWYLCFVRYDEHWFVAITVLWDVVSSNFVDRCQALEEPTASTFRVVK
jgi:hypothetical protein